MNLPISMQTWRIALLAATIALCSCGGGGGDGSSVDPLHRPRPRLARSRNRIWTSLAHLRRRAAHAGDFYTDAAPSGEDYVSTVHLKNSDIEASEVVLAQPLYELCTNDWNEALAWSESSAAKNVAVCRSRRRRTRTRDTSSSAARGAANRSSISVHASSNALISIAPPRTCAQRPARRVGSTSDL